MRGFLKSKTDPAERQLRETPMAIVRWCVRKYGCRIDLAASFANKRLYHYLSDVEGKLEEGYRGEAFAIKWHQLQSVPYETPITCGFCNPPYAQVGKWLEKARIEALCGFTSVFLVNTFNGEKWNELCMHAREIILLEGRVSFILPSTGKPDPGNNRGSMLCIFGPHVSHAPAFSYMRTPTYDD